MEQQIRVPPGFPLRKQGYCTEDPKDFKIGRQESQRRAEHEAEKKATIPRTR